MRRVAFGRIDRRHQRLLPGAVQAARHQVVHQVVAPRHRMEHVVHQRLLVAQRHPAEAEIGLFFLRFSRHRSCGTDDSAARRAARQSAPEWPWGWIGGRPCRLQACEHDKRLNARTPRSRDRAPRACARDGRRALRRGGGQSRRSALAAAEGFRAAAQGPDGERARPPGQVSAGRSVVGRRAGDASRHVGLVPRDAGQRRDDARRRTITTAPRIWRTTMWCSACRRARRSASTIRAGSAR